MHGNPGTEGDAGDPADFRFLVEGLQPVKSRGGVGQFARTIVEHALAAADATKVEAQHGKAAGLEHAVKRMHNRVVHGSAEGGVRMQDEGNGCARGFGLMIARFDAACWSVENHFWHGASFGWANESLYLTPLVGIIISLLRIVPK